MHESTSWYADEALLVEQVRRRHLARGAAPVIPGYDDLHEISRGGQGVVYRGTQRSTHRRVAVKVLLDGAFASETSRMRFSREIDLVSRLRHPNIVSVYDSGVTPDNRPYCVMEYVDGLPLDEYVANLIGDKSARGGIRPLLELFIKICDAVNFAHQRGVIHRDLKPSNIRIESGGEPRVLDFGLAKIAADDSTVSDRYPVMTVSGQFFGSLPWASPEQAEGKPGRIDIRTDVYALGVILYRLLTWQFPYDVTGNLREVIDQILTAEPVRPSTLRAQVDEELETIVLKCLAKQPDRRYQTAGDLARDLRHYLAGEPIEAKRDSAWYTFRKTALRYRVALIVTTGIVILSLAFGVTMAAMYRTTNRALSAEETARAESGRALESEAAARIETERENTRSQQIQQFLQDMLASVRPERARGRDVSLLREVLDQAAARLQTELDTQPEVQAALLDTIGRAYQGLDILEPAEAALQRAYDLRLAALGPEHPLSLISLNNMGALRLAQKRFEEAEVIHRRALELRRRLLGPDSPDTLISQTQLGLALTNLGRLGDAEPLYRDALERARATLGEDSHELLAAINNLAALLHRQGKFAEAEPLLREALEKRIRLSGEDHPETLTVLSNLAYLLDDLDRRDEAEQMLRRALDVGRRVLGEEHAMTQILMNNLAHLLQNRGKLDEAEPLFRAVYDLRLETLGAEHSDTLISANNLALLLFSLDQVDEAETLLRRTLDIRRRTVGNENFDTAISMNSLGQVLVERGAYEEAEALFREAVGVCRKVLPSGHWITGGFLGNLGRCLGRLQRFGEAEKSLLEAHEILRAALGPDHQRAMELEAKLAELYDAWNKPDLAARYRPASAPASD